MTAYIYIRMQQIFPPTKFRSNYKYTGEFLQIALLPFSFFSCTMFTEADISTGHLRRKEE